MVVSTSSLFFFCLLIAVNMKETQAHSKLKIPHQYVSFVLVLHVAPGLQRFLAFKIQKGSREAVYTST